MAISDTAPQCDCEFGNAIQLPKDMCVFPIATPKSRQHGNKTMVTPRDGDRESTLQSRS